VLYAGKKGAISTKGIEIKGLIISAEISNNEATKKAARLCGCLDTKG
jgi:hypothetical protein